MEPSIPNPVFLNLEYIFFLIYRAVARIFNFLFGADFFSTFKIWANVLLIILITIILYCLVRLYEIKQEDKPKKIKSSSIKNITNNNTDDPLHFIEKSSSIQNETWQKVRTKLLSDNPSDWRLAIIEADIYLDKVLDQKGFYGDTLGDKLKQISPEKLPSIQIAWEAHKVRNRIAHDGSGFILTMPEARRTLSYYEIVFRDLEVID